MTTALQLLGCLLTYALAVNAVPTPAQNYTCEVNGQVYGEGETVGNPCDGCVCSRYGTMCELRLCPEAPCPDNDKVIPPGECCATCPNGNYCEYKGKLGRGVIPIAGGCKYSEDSVCFCYKSRIKRKYVPYCLPLMPWENLRPCIITTPNRLNTANKHSNNPKLEFFV